MGTGSGVRAVAIAFSTAVIALAVTLAGMAVYAFSTSSDVSLGRLFAVMFAPDGTFEIVFRIDWFGLAVILATIVLAPLWHLLLRRPAKSD